jgi:hypothetical protein
MTTYAGDTALMTAGSAGFTTPVIDLFTAGPGALTKNMTWAQFTAAVFTGYAGPITVTVSAIYISNSSGLVSVDISEAVFNGPTSGTGVDVIGWAFRSNPESGTPVLYAAGLFTGPLGLQLPTDRVTVGETIGLAPAVSFNVEN